MLPTTTPLHSTTDQTQNSVVPGSYVDQYLPPAQPTHHAPTTATQQPATILPPRPAQKQSTSELLEDQNIFYLLGVTDGTEEQREKFLDELQQVIWEDFLEYDAKLLITQDEYTELSKIMNSPSQSDLDKQEKIVVYLEKLVPDLEEIMLDKALELKEELVRERVAGLRQFLAEQPEKLEKLTQTEQLMQAGKWRSAAEVMNTLK